MRKAAVIGHPVAHSLSPRLHGFWLAQHKIDGEYSAIDVAPEALAGFIKSEADPSLCGMNITVPHKEKILSLIDVVDETATAIGAINTITLIDGKWHGTNYDAYGFSENLRAQGFPAAKNKAVILGAGGAARAIVKALVDANFAHIVLVNRTAAKAEAIAKNATTRVDVATWEERAKILEGADLLVNATTLGMQGKAPLELDLSALPTAAVVNDIVYAPLETPLLASAKARGNSCVDGLGMLLHQAVPAFEAWFGVRPVVDDALRKAVLNG